VRRDGRIFLWHALRNELLYRNSATREALRKVAWAGHDDLSEVNTFRSWDKRLRETHPQYFIEEAESQADVESEPTERQIQQIGTLLSAQNDPIRKQLADALARLDRMRLGLLLLLVMTGVLLLLRIFA